MFPVGTLTVAQTGQWQSIPQLSAKLPACTEAITALSGTDGCYGNWTVEVLWQDMKGCSCSLRGERMTSRCRKGKQSQGSLWGSQPVRRAQTWGESCATFTRRKQFCDFGVKGEKRNALWRWRKDVTNLYFLSWAFCVIGLMVNYSFMLYLWRPSDGVCSALWISW